MGTRSPVLDRRKAGFDRAGGGSRSLDALGNLLGGAQRPSPSTSRPLLLLVLRLGGRLGALLDELLGECAGEWRASPPARFFHSRLLPTSTSTPTFGGVGKPSDVQSRVGKPSDVQSPRSRSSPTCAQ